MSVFIYSSDFENFSVSSNFEAMNFYSYPAYGWQDTSKAFLTNEICDSIRIPENLKVNNKEILCSLLRGLFDTDGSIYFRSQGTNESSYPVISFTSISKELVMDMFEILKMLGFKPNVYLSSKITARVPNERYAVVLYGYANFELYKKLISTRQPKNINKLKVWEEKFSKGRLGSSSS